MSLNPKYWLTALIIIGVTLVAKAGVNASAKSVDYTIRKDSIQTTKPDTNRAIVVYPNPFISIISTEPKK